MVAPIDDPLAAAVRTRLEGAGPRVGTLPVIGPEAGSLASGAQPGRRGRWVVAAVALVALGGGGAAVAVVGGEDGSGAAPAPTSAPVAPSTSAGTSPTTAAPAATTTLVPVDQLPEHEAVYRDGKLHLQGTLPSEEVAERFRREAAQVIGADNVEVDYRIDPRVPVPTDGRVRVDESFLFAPGSAAVDPADEPVFDLGVAALVANPEATMRIVGHTDDVGDPEANRQLSLARAQAAADHLIAAGIDPSRIVVEGRGEDQPIVPNDTEAGRAENRRIEVVLVGLLAG